MHVEKLLFCAALLSAYLIAASCGGDTPETSEKPRAAAVVLYAARDAGLMQAVLDAYTAETGVPILLTTESGQAGPGAGPPEGDFDAAFDHFAKQP